MAETTLDEETRAIARRQRIAEMLMQQGSEPLETNQMAGGYVVPVSPLAGVAKVAQQLSGAYIGKKADEKAAALDQRKMAVIQQLYSGDKAPSIKDVAASGTATPSELMAMAAADRAAQQKVHREGVPPGFNPTETGGLESMFMPDGTKYSDFLLQQAGAKAQMPSYGEPDKLALAQDANAMAHEKLQMDKAEQNRKALEALQPKPISEYQQYVLDEKKAKKEADYTDAVSNIDDTILDFNKLKTIQARTTTGPYVSSAPALAVRKALPESWGGGEDLQRLEQGYNNMAVKALSAFKAGGVTFGALSNAEGDWVRSTTAKLDKGGSVNQEILDEGLRLLANRKKRIEAQAKPKINVDIDPNTSPEDRAALEADIAKEKAKGNKPTSADDLAKHYLGK